MTNIKFLNYTKLKGILKNEKIYTSMLCIQTKLVLFLDQKIQLKNMNMRIKII